MMEMLLSSYTENTFGTKVDKDNQHVDNQFLCRHQSG